MRIRELVHGRAKAMRGRAEAAFLTGDTEAFARFMRGMYADLDECVRHLHENFPPPFELGCSEGCCYCCHSPIWVSTPEAVYLAMEVGARFPARALDMIFHLCARHKRCGYAGAEIWRSMVTCPLLEDGRCLAYEFRPLACRGCNSMDRELCGWAFAMGWAEMLVPRYAPQALASFQYREEIVRAAGTCGLYAMCAPLAAFLPALIGRGRPGHGWLK